MNIISDLIFKKMHLVDHPKISFLEDPELH